MRNEKCEDVEHGSRMTKQPHLCVDQSQVNERVILCGDPDRAERIATLLDKPINLGQNREFRLFNGDYQGVPITVCSCGIGAPSLIIAVEELRLCGAGTVIRVGSSGALQPEIAIGDLIVAEGGVRDEGASHAYVSGTFPAFADFELVHHMVNFLSTTASKYHVGVVRSHDSFYRDDEAEICRYWHKKGVLAADMETAALFTVGRLRGLRVAAILNNVVRYEQDVQEGVSQYVESEQAMMTGEKIAILTALNALKQIKNNVK